MKKLVVLLALATLLIGCHRADSKGTPGLETGSYQGSGSLSNVDHVIIPQNPPY